MSPGLNESRMNTLCSCFWGCYYYTPRFSKVDRGVYWYHLFRLSVCPSVDRIVSALYLQQYSLDPFHICTSYQATSEGVSRVMPVSKFKNLTWDPIWLNGMGNHEAAGVSSERRRSSCSSYFSRWWILPVPWSDSCQSWPARWQQNWLPEHPSLSFKLVVSKPDANC